MRILILGVTGGVGRHLTEQALSRGHELTALVRRPSKLSVLAERMRVSAGLDVGGKNKAARAVCSS